MVYYVSSCYDGTLLTIACECCNEEPDRRPELLMAIMELKVAFRDLTDTEYLDMKSEEQLQKQSSNFLTELARQGLVGPGLTEHGLRVTFAAEIKRVTGANDDQVAAALGDRDVRMGRHYTRHVEQEARIIQVFFGQHLKKGKAKVSEAALIEHVTAHVLETIREKVG